MGEMRDDTLWSRVSVTMAVLAVYELGSMVPLPGLDPARLFTLLQSTGAMQRISILSLGIMPLLNALILLEALKLVAPGVRLWELASLGNERRFQQIVAGLTLLLALAQAAGMALALEGVDGLVVEPGTSFRLICITTLLGGAALAAAFAALIDREGVGYGLWLLFLAPALAALPGLLAAIADAVGRGEYSAAGFALSGIFSLIAVAGMASLVLAARAAPATVATCMWTPFIANAVLGPLLIAVGWLATRNADAAAAAATPANLGWYIALAIIVPLATWLAVRSYELAGEPSPVPAAPIAATLTAILTGGALLERHIGLLLPLAPAQLIVAATVATTLLIKCGYAGGPGASKRPQAISPRA